MKVKPLKNYKTPAYPGIEIILRQPDLLLKHMPASWKKNRLIVTAMISFSVAACKAQQKDAPTVIPQEQQSAGTFTSGKNNQVNPSSTGDSTKIAPVFIHGEGVGVSGCVMIAPPVYLSEEDAMKIIKSELKKEGLLIEDKFTGDSIKVRHTVLTVNPSSKNYEDYYKDSVVTTGLIPDAYNQQLNMVIEYVSFKDYRDFADEERSMSSVSDYDIRAAAVKIREELKRNNKYNAVVFYDPVGWGDWKKDRDWNRLEAEGKEKAVEMLKLQVADFITWLKKEQFLNK